MQSASRTESHLRIFFFIIMPFHCYFGLLGWWFGRWLAALKISFHTEDDFSINLHACFVKAKCRSDAIFGSYTIFRIFDLGNIINCSCKGRDITIFVVLMLWRSSSFLARPCIRAALMNLEHSFPLIRKTEQAAASKAAIVLIGQWPLWLASAVDFRQGRHGGNGSVAAGGEAGSFIGKSNDAL